MLSQTYANIRNVLPQQMKQHSLNYKNKSYNYYGKNLCRVFPSSILLEQIYYYMYMYLYMKLNVIPTVSKIQSTVNC